MNIVLVEPEIPQNTGNIARTCAATGAKLHLIKPFGFELSDRYLKRAGLDYWGLMEYAVYENWADFAVKNTGAGMYFLSTKAARCYTEPAYRVDDYLVFGKETRGLNEELLKKYYDRCVRIPMRSEARSLNLANSVNIVLYEALRQQGFPGLKQDGELSGREEPAWEDYV